MAQYDGSIRINTLLNTKEFERGSRWLISGMERIGKSINGIISSLGFAIGIAGLVALGKQAIDTASDIQEVQNVVDTAFGSMSYKMEQFAKTSVRQFGISQLSAKQLGSTFMAMGASMLGNMEEASDMAINLTARAADMASFYNKSIQETSTALKSIYTGETESLKEYGVVMTQVNLQEFARQQGINKTIQAMTQAEKVQLQYAYVMQQTSLSSGDFARTSDSWANQTRILSEQFKELISVIGSGLIVVFTPVVKSLNTVLSMLIAIAKQIGAIMSKLFGISIPVADSSKFAEDLSEAAGGADELTEGMKEAGKAAKGALAPFDDLNVLAKEAGGSASGDSGIGSGVGGIGGVDIDMLEEAPIESEWEELANKIENILSQVFGPFKQAWDSQGKFVMDSWKYAFEEIGFLAKSVGSDFLEVWNQPETVSMLENMLIVVGDIGLAVGNLAENFRLAWDENDTGKQILETIRDIISDIVDHVRNMADSFVEFTGGLDFFPLLNSVLRLLQSLKPLADNVGEGLEWFWKNVLLPMAGWAIEDAVPTFLDMLSAAIDAVNEVVEVLKPLGIWLWEEFLQPIGQWAGDTIIDAMETITDLLAKLGDWISENQETLQGFAVTMGILFSVSMAEKILSVGMAIGEYIINAGGLSAILQTLTGFLFSNTAAWLSNTAAKIADKIETLAIIGLYAKDFVVNLAKGTVELIKQAAQFAINTAAKIADTAAQIAMTAATVAWNAVCAIATAVTTAFGAAVTFLTSPIGLVIIAIGALIAIIAILIIYWDDIKAAIVAFWDKCVEIFSEIADWFKEKFDAVKEVISSILESIKEKWNAVWGSIKDFASNVWEGIKTKISEIITLIKNVITSVLNTIKSTWSTVWETIKTVASTIWDAIKSTISTIIDGIKTTISTALENIKTTWNNIWTGLKTSVIDIFNGIWSAIKKTINSILGGVEKMANGVVSAINKIIEAINGLEIENPFTGEEIWSPNIKPIPPVSIPRLATGAVIRGGNPFMAILGDQPAGQTNIEAPLDTIRQAVREELSGINFGNAGSGQTRVVLNINGIDVGEAMLDDLFSVMSRRGYDVSVLGVT